MHNAADRGSFVSGAWVPVGAPEGEIVRGAPHDLDLSLPVFAWHRDHVDRAVEAARRAFPAWDALGLAGRRVVLLRVRDALRDAEDDLAALVMAETGKVAREARAEAKALVAKVDITLGEGLGLVQDTAVDARMGWRWRPHGVLAVLGPFNFPLHLPHGHVAPALLMGNTVVMKPSEVAPGCGQLYAEVLAAAGVPEGVFNLVQGEGSVGARLGAHPDVDGVLFTGSYAVGTRLLAANAASPGRLLALELGGKNAALVLDDAHFDKALDDIVQSAFATTGQRCSCASRLIVTRGIAERFLDALARRVASLRVGHPLDPAAFCGPLASPAAFARFEALQRAADAEGSEVLGEAPPPAVQWEGRALRGCYAAPRVRRVARRDGQSAYQRDELFGPDLAAYVVNDLDEAVALANDTPYGLCAGVWTADAAAFESAARRLRVGALTHNAPTVGASSRLPFGGVGRSGNHRPAGVFSTLYCVYPMSVTRGADA